MPHHNQVLVRPALLSDKHVIHAYLLADAAAKVLYVHYGPSMARFSSRLSSCLSSCLSSRLC